MASVENEDDTYSDYPYEDLDISESDDATSAHSVPEDGAVVDVLEEPQEMVVGSEATTPLYEDQSCTNSSIPKTQSSFMHDSVWSPLMPLSKAVLPSLESDDKRRMTICGKPFCTENDWFTGSFTKDEFRQFVLDQTKLTIWMAKRRLIANECFCANCPRPIAMLLSREISHSDFFVWRCRKCNRRTPIRSQSVFDKLKCSLDVLMYLVYLWSEGFTFDEMCQETGISPSLITIFINRLRAVCSWQLKRETDCLEGVIEIAEGAYLDPPRICALAGVERFGNRCFLVRLPQENCNQKLLIRFIRHRVKPGSTIITGDWPGYKPLGALPEGYAHLVADHESNASIQKADNMLEQLAMFFDEIQSDCREQFSSILDEFVWRRIPCPDRFSKVCYILSHLYNLS